MRKLLGVLCLVLSTTCNAKSCIASWYGPGFHGKKMSNGKVYNMHKMTAAHKSLRLGTKLLVTSERKSIKVTVTDRLPRNSRRCLDLSYGAAKRLGFIKRGLTRIKYNRI